MSGGADVTTTVRNGVDANTRWPITFFPNFGASSKREELWSLEALARHIAATTAPEKGKLPWLKLATFGEVRTDKNSLRHDGNVLTVTGIEADYDAEQMTFDEAVDIATGQGVLAIVYTSPSHSEDRQRWRVLCPFSRPMRSDDRAKMLGRLNGLYRGIFSGESWTLSQSYYFGSVASNPSHQVEVIDGAPIDLHDDLDETWAGKPNTAPVGSGQSASFRSGPLNEVELLDAIASGNSYHAAQVRLLGRWARDGVPYMEARARLEAAMDNVFPPDRDARWEMRRADIDRCLDDIYVKEAVAKDAGRRNPGRGSEPAADQNAGSAEAEAPGAAGAVEDIPTEFSDEFLALRFSVSHAGHLRYVAAWGRWYEWTGVAWRPDSTLRVFDLARTLCRQASAESDNHRIGAKVASASTVAAVERLAKADRRHASTVEQWDLDAWLLNTPGGTVDLRTGQLRPHSPSDHITKVTAVTPGGACPLWLRFLATVTAGDVELQRYLKRMAGYCLTGSIREHALFFAYGTGGNGKGVFLNTLTAILADYAVVASMDTFTASQSDRHPADLAMLRGARLVTAQETEEGRRWAESRIKALTGGDPITARFMRMDFFTYQPVFKLLIAGNHRPGLRSVDEAIRRRFNQLPFVVSIPAAERDLELPDKLRAEWSGIFQWAIDGALEWQRDGLCPPAAVTEATAEYLESEDATGVWLRECTTRASTFLSPSSTLYASWKAWAEAAGEEAGSQKRFSQNLKARGIEQDRIPNDGRAGFRGLAVKPDARDRRYGD